MDAQVTRGRVSPGVPGHRGLGVPWPVRCPRAGGNFFENASKRARREIWRCFRFGVSFLCYRRAGQATGAGSAGACRRTWMSGWPAADRAHGSGDAPPGQHRFRDPGEFSGIIPENSPGSRISQHMERSISYAERHIGRALGSRHNHRRYLSIAIPATSCSGGRRPRGDRRVPAPQRHPPRASPATTGTATITPRSHRSIPPGPCGRRIKRQHPDGTTTAAPGTRCKDQTCVLIICGPKSYRDHENAGIYGGFRHLDHDG
jgi:hypothetical protein